MNHLDIRKKFKNFFKQQNHTWLKSSSLIPFNDPSLLFVNAGMNPFKNVFLGIESAPHLNVTSIQKCMRAGGKHNDLEQIGPSHHHHTFFEMMGNFSFGGYSKKEACHLAWNFLTKELSIPKENLAVSVFKEDKETAQIWKTQLNIPQDRIFLMGEKDNFWRMGESGPCGPCSEIYFEPQAFRSKKNSMIEIWNLVFMEYNEDQNKTKTPLPHLCIDTGMGLERLLTLLQNENSNYHTSLLRPLLETASQTVNIPYVYKINKEPSSNSILRILADHARSIAFLISDGVSPSNESRGYVLRRIIRRALYSGKSLTNEKEILNKVIQTVIQTYAPVYSELNLQKEIIFNTLKQEEKKFLMTLDQGKSLLTKELFQMQKQKQKTLSAETTFRLYDTYGFPIDLVNLICKEKGFDIDHKGFNQKMQTARTKSQKARLKISKNNSFKNLKEIQNNNYFHSNTSITKFIGYDQLKSSSTIKALFDENHSPVRSLKAPCTAFIIFDQTCFYAEGGGQVGDQGTIFKEKSTLSKGVIEDCQNVQDKYIHMTSMKEGELRVGDTYSIEVHADYRKQTAIHHSATHLLHSALRKLLGSQVRQAGSFVGPDRLRFDFTYSQSLSEEERFQIEDLVNQQINNSLNVEVLHKSYSQALKEGVLSFFEKSPSSKVRVLNMGAFSSELCGGTHIQNTQDIQYFKILSESSLSSGIRRIEALCGRSALQFLTQLSRENLKIRQALNLPIRPHPTSSFDLLKEVQKLKDTNQRVKKSKPSISLSSLENLEKFTLNSKKGIFYCSIFSEKNPEFLSTITDQIKQKYPLAVVVVVSEISNQKIPIVISLPKNISEIIPASSLIKNLGGKGGGPPHFAKGALNQSLSKKVLRTKILNFLHNKNFLKDLK